MNTRDLAYFQQLVLLKNFSKVATHFGVTQPTITTAIKRLEATFAARLFQRDRVHHRLEITPAGRQLATHVDTILNELTVAQQEIDRTTRQQTTLALPPIIENHYFTAVAASLQQAHLLNNLRTMTGGSVWLKDALRDGHADLALLGSLAPLADPDLTAHVFDQQPFSLLVSVRHPLAHRTGVAFAELRQEPFVLLNDRFIHHAAVNQLARQNHFRPNVVFHANNPAIITKLVAQNVGVGFLTNIAITERPDVVRIPLLDANQPTFLTSIVTRTNHTFTPAQAQILALIKATLPHLT